MSHCCFLLCSQPSPFDSKPSAYLSSSAKPLSPETAASTTAADENQEPEQPGTPIPSEDPEAADNGEPQSSKELLKCHTVLFDPCVF